MATWYQDPITQAHGVNNEQGVDFGTPFHTPLTAILGGTVQGVNCGVPWACEVDISTAMNGQSYVESYLHVDQPLVAMGQVLRPGDVVGLSGGQLSGGLNPDSPAVSTGPHVEFDLFQGTQPWSNPIDPTAIAQAGPGGSGGPSNPIGNLPVIGGLVGSGLQTGQQLAGGTFDPWSGFQSAVGGVASSFGNWVHDRVVPFAGAEVLALVVAAVVLLVIFGTGQRQSGGSPTVLPVPV